MVKAGYAKSIHEASELDARTVVQALHYEAFLTDWEMAFMELNKVTP